MIPLSVFKNVVKSNYLASNEEDKKNIEDEIAEKLGFDNLNDFFNNNSEAIFGAFHKIMQRSEIDQTLVPKSLSHIADNLFNGDKEALRGFFIIRATDNINKYNLPRFRFHQFYKYIEGLWAELLPQTEENKRLFTINSTWSFNFIQLGNIYEILIEMKDLYSAEPPFNLLTSQSFSKASDFISSDFTFFQGGTLNYTNFVNGVRTNFSKPEIEIG